MRLTNIYIALKEQMPLKKFIRNFLGTGNGWGLFSLNSHINKKIGKPKVVYPSSEAAEKVAEAMSKRYNKDITAYKCMFCDGYHIGNNR